MELQIQARNFDLNQTTRDYVSNRMDRLGRRLPDNTKAKVEITGENTRQRESRVVAQVTLDVDGTMIRGEERGANAAAALDSVVDVLERRVERYKGKTYRTAQAKRLRREPSARLGSAIPDEPQFVTGTAESPEGAQDKPVKIKRFPLKPMTVDEAAFQMEMLGHEFFLFLDSETAEHHVIYRRRDGNYGLIQPEPL